MVYIYPYAIYHVTCHMVRCTFLVGLSGRSFFW